jgi:hypothetical protein
LRSPMHRVEPAWLRRSLALLARHVEHASAAGVREVLGQMHAAPELAGAPPVTARR